MSMVNSSSDRFSPNMLRNIYCDQLFNQHMLIHLKYIFCPRWEGVGLVNTFEIHFFLSNMGGNLVSNS